MNYMWGREVALIVFQAEAVGEKYKAETYDRAARSIVESERLEGNEPHRSR